VVLWHGFLATSYVWHKVAPKLAAAAVDVEYLRNEEVGVRRREEENRADEILGHLVARMARAWRCASMTSAGKTMH
jgi:hypothetical protein